MLANSDIAAVVADPNVDLGGTFLTPSTFWNRFVSRAFRRSPLLPPVESFLEQVGIFTFPNVVGATHGVILDVLKKLKREGNDLEILGDGSQQKPYLHVFEVIDARLLIIDGGSDRLNCFNIGPADEGVAVLSLVRMVVERAAPSARLRFAARNRGWVGDVPNFRYSIDKLKQLGRAPAQNSAKAIRRAVEEICREDCITSLR